MNLDLSTFKESRFALSHSEQSLSSVSKDVFFIRMNYTSVISKMTGNGISNRKSEVIYIY